MSNLHDGDHVHHGHQDDHHHLEAGEGRREADLVGGTRMGTSCHLAYLLHIFTIAVIITGIVTQKSAQDRDLFRDYFLSETDSEFVVTNLGH